MFDYENLIYSTIGERIKKYRLSKLFLNRTPWTQQKLADETGISLDAINALENGKCKNCKYYMSTGRAEILQKQMNLNSLNELYFGNSSEKITVITVILLGLLESMLFNRSSEPYYFHLVQQDESLYSNTYFKTLNCTLEDFKKKTCYPIHNDELAILCNLYYSTVTQEEINTMKVYYSQRDLFSCIIHDINLAIPYSYRFLDYFYRILTVEGKKGLMCRQIEIHNFANKYHYSRKTFMQLAKDSTLYNYIIPAFFNYFYSNINYLDSNFEMHLFNINSLKELKSSFNSLFTIESNFFSAPPDNSNQESSGLEFLSKPIENISDRQVLYFDDTDKGFLYIVNHTDLPFSTPLGEILSHTSGDNLSINSNTSDRLLQTLSNFIWTAEIYCTYNLRHHSEEDESPEETEELLRFYKAEVDNVILLLLSPLMKNKIDNGNITLIPKILDYTSKIYQTAIVKHNIHNSSY